MVAVRRPPVKAIQSSMINGLGVGRVTPSPNCSFTEDEMLGELYFLEIQHSLSTPPPTQSLGPRDCAQIRRPTFPEDLQSQRTRAHHTTRLSGRRTTKG